MNKFNLSKFLVENKLTQLGRLTEMGGNPKDYVNIFKYYGFTIKDNSSVHFDGFKYKVFNFGHQSDNLGNKKITLRLPSRNDPDFNYQTEELSKVLKSGTYTFTLDNFELNKLHEFLNRVSSKLASLGNMNELTEMGDDSSEGYMGTEYESSEDMAVDMAKKGVYEEESEVEEDYSKYGSVEDLMKEIETSTNEAAHKHKMERVEKAYKYLEEKASSLEEGGDANFLNPAKMKEMKTSAKKLRMMHEKLLKEYDKKYASKKKVESKLNEEVDTEFPLSADDVAAMAGGSSIRVYKKGGGRVHTYSNGQEFLDFFDKHEPNLVYKQESPRVFAATDAPLEEPRGYVSPSEPVDRDRGIQNFYDRLKYKGD
jgi:hypothetical protein